MPRRLSVPAEQQGHLDLLDLSRALSKLPPDQREALILVGAEGFSYEDAAAISGCAVGTVKSRVNRARSRLNELMTATAGRAAEAPTAADPPPHAAALAHGPRCLSPIPQSRLKKKAGQKPAFHLVIASVVSGSCNLRIRSVRLVVEEQAPG